MGLFGISKELQSRVCNHGEPRAKRRGKLLYYGEKEVGRAIVNEESIGGIESLKYSDFSLAEF